MKKPRIAVIGAGSSGLAATKQCLDDELEPVCFEQSSHTGGLWKYVDIDNTENKDPHSSIFKSVIINTSSKKMTFSDFPIPPEWPVYLHNSLVAKYFDMYAEHFNLLAHIKFNTTVINVSILPDKRWRVRYVTRGEGNDEEKEDIFDYVMVCAGHHRFHRWPKYKGMDVFKGEQIHSHFYRRAKYFEDKRVLVVGAGNSGLDISVELSYVASQVYLCVRRGTLPWIFPHILNGKPLDYYSRFFGTMLPSSLISAYYKKSIKNTLGELPPDIKPKEPIFSSHITMKSSIFERIISGTLIVKKNIKELKSDKSIEFVDGSILEDIDVIIYATGYNIEFPFLDRNIVSGGEEIEKQFDEEYRENLAWMYKMIFPPKYPNIAFIGLVQPDGPIFPVAEMQCRYVTSLIKGFVKPLPSPSEMERCIRKSQEKNLKQFYSSARHTVEVNFITYMDELAEDIGCYPYSLAILRKYGFGVWKNVHFGLFNPIQYRLLGRHSWEGAPEAIFLYNTVDPKIGKTLKNNEKTKNRSNGKYWLLLTLIGLMVVMKKTRALETVTAFGKKLIGNQ
ncbi:9832_t:CDS:2 [Acaulospora morrowiae]|uniref:Flavin-containing monooxygenase 1 n=1 Tax=Acaulospora morrowiae TaxID=94023 RepID=A0A9N8V566_9GLOM|nr:9832_t:CDS:2 [Acaulospora morrowiae]